MRVMPDNGMNAYGQLRMELQDSVYYHMKEIKK